MTNNNELRWREFWRRLGAPGDPLPAYTDLVARYGEKHRAYHTLAHIEHCLQELDSVRTQCIDLNAAEMALWYHDAIYAPRAKDNEEKSAALAVKAGGRWGLPASFLDRVSALILATRHQVIPDDPDAQRVVDIDLAILGQPAARFAAYEKQIRREYKWAPKFLYDKGRAAILKSVVDRSHIYSSDYFHDRYEAVARVNLSRALEAL